MKYTTRYLEFIKRFYLGYYLPINKLAEAFCTEFDVSDDELLNSVDNESAQKNDP